MKIPISTQNPDFSLQIATPKDANLIVSFIKKLAKYQKMEDLITTTPIRMEKLLKEKLGEAIFGIYQGDIIAFAYFHQKSSAFTGRKGLYIDAFFVDDCVRGKGLGKIIFQYLTKYSQDIGCEYLEWACLDWNKPAIKFYEKLGANCIDSLRIYRLSPEALSLNVKEFEQN
ncbi:GNAT family N-acetyltransferase [Halarcobacter ebronensis]|uniref:GNAT family N-acetyltransferase n=1 Tax=Halarcobacter ebronensis TaxID=1462615 RepID=A0A4Q1AKT8_9BACT|nr:GNAT family N-acetyltransferase [Halarcobacter ebronensis]QKF83047.1 acetyltransferase (GNAT family) [Halarcobacter ebronensis]RXK00856.1 GNAT family N-acetyltransferase [Halarcobacter ebronensis]